MPPGAPPDVALPGLILARPSTRALARQDGAALQDLATPDTAGLMPGQRRGKARGADRAATAQLLGPLQLGGGLSEPQVWVVGTTRLFEPVVLCGVEHDGDIDRTRLPMRSVRACPGIGRERCCGHAIHPPVTLTATWPEHRHHVEGQPVTARFELAFLRMWTALRGRVGNHVPQASSRKALVNQRSSRWAEQQEPGSVDA